MFSLAAPWLGRISQTHLPCFAAQKWGRERGSDAFAQPVRVQASTGRWAQEWMSDVTPAPGGSHSPGQGTQGSAASPEGESGRQAWGPRAHQPARPPQVDELYEGYCIQCRLRDGASNMQRAFSRCPPSRASRESLQELGRSLQECTEVGGSEGCRGLRVCVLGGGWTPRTIAICSLGPPAGRIRGPPFPHLTGPRGRP